MARPKQLNAFNPDMMREMIDALDRVDAHDDVRAVIVTGEGRAFCAGADISGGAEGFITEADEPLVRGDGGFNYANPAARDGGGRLTLHIFRCLKPVIAAINGPAVGFGVTMTRPMDIRRASDTAEQTGTACSRGLPPGGRPAARPVYETRRL